MNNSWRANKGFGLIEIVIGSAILSVALLSISNLFQSTLLVSGRTQSAVQGDFLLEEGMEIVKLLRDTSYKSNFCATTPSGNLYTGNNTDNSVTKIDTNGNIITRWVVGTAPNAFAFDSASNLYVANYTSHTISKITPEGVLTEPWVDLGSGGLGPSSLAFDASGNLYSANYDSNNIIKIKPDKTFTTFASFSAGTGPNSIAFDTAGNLFVANYGNGTGNTVKKISPAGAVTTFATLTVAPWMVAIDASGYVYTVNYLNNSVKRFDTSGTLLNTWVVNTAPYSIAFDGSGNRYVTNYGNGTGSTVSKISSTGVVTPSWATGVGAGPVSIALDASGNMYTSNYGSGGSGTTVSKITSAGVVTSAWANLGATNRGPNPLAFAPTCLAGGTTGPYYFSWNGTSWVTTNVNTLIDGKFERKLTLSSAYRDVNGDISPTGTYDPDINIATVSVAWKDQTGTTTRSIRAYIVNIFGN